MHDSKTEALVEQSRSQAVGFAETRDAFNSMPIIGWLAKSAGLAPPWWSTRRDMWLSKHWKKSDHLASVVYNAQSKLVNIPPKVVPNDLSIQSHVALGEQMQQRLLLVSEFGAGWSAAMVKFYEDYLTQDNGAFLEIIGPGNPAGPIVGLPISVRHLSARQCTRTGDPEFPIVYTTVNGKRYMLHESRVIAISQMTSPIEEMNGVGFCPVSRAIGIAQNLMDIVRYKQERLGSRPHSKMLIGKGVRASDIVQAFSAAEQQEDNMGLAIAGLMVAIGSDSTDIDIDVKELTHLDPFDEETSITLGMYAIASAFGLDISEVWPASSGASTADARISLARTRGKLPSQVTNELATQLNLKFVPPQLHVRFDFRDDEEDQQRALVRDIRGRHRLRETESGVLTVRAARLQMLRDRDITQPEFAELELADGRLADGLPISTLFFSEDPVYSALLTFEGVDNPINFIDNDPMEMVSAISLRKAATAATMDKTSGEKRLDKLKRVYSALEWLEGQYMHAMMTLTPEEEEEVEEEEVEEEEDAQDEEE